MRYVLPTVPNVCCYTTLAKKKGKIFTCLATALVLFPQDVFVLEPDFVIFAVL